MLLPDTNITLNTHTHTPVVNHVIKPWIQWYYLLLCSGVWLIRQPRVLQPSTACQNTRKENRNGWLPDVLKQRRSPRHNRWCGRHIRQGEPLLCLFRRLHSKVWMKATWGRCKYLYMSCIHFPSAVLLATVVWANANASTCWNSRSDRVFLH